MINIYTPPYQMGGFFMACLVTKYMLLSMRATRVAWVGTRGQFMKDITRKDNQSSASAILSALSSVGMDQLDLYMTPPDSSLILDGKTAGLVLDSIACDKDVKTGVYPFSQGDTIGDTYFVLSNNSKNGIKIIPITWLCLNFRHASGQGVRIGSLENVKKLVEFERMYQLEQQKATNKLLSAAAEKQEIKNTKAELYTKIMGMGGFDLAPSSLVKEHEKLMVEYYRL
jgi:hypothetical protein